MVEIVERDLFSQCIFLDNQSRLQLNTKIYKYFNELKTIFYEKNIIANIYYTGSLARQEPAAVFCNGQYQLESDIDFVIATKDDFRNNEWLLNITDWLNFNFPEFKSSVVLTTINKINNIKSFLGRDLSFSIDCPIYQGIDNIKYEPVHVDVKNYIENFINVLSCYFLHPEVTNEKSNSILYKNIDHFYIKLVLEGMRMQFSYGDNQIIRYSELYMNRFSKKLSNLIDANQVVDFLKARELSQFLEKPQINLLSFIKTAIEKPFLSLYKDNTINVIKNNYLYASDFITTFQGGLISFLMISDPEIDNFTEWKDIFSIQLSRLLSFNECRNIKKVNPKNYEELVRLMREIRLAYVKALYYHNTTVKEIPDLNQINRRGDNL